MKKAGTLLFLIFAFLCPLFSETAAERELQKTELEKALIRAEQQYNQKLVQNLENLDLEQDFSTENTNKTNSDVLWIFWSIVTIFILALVFIGFFWVKQQKIYQVQLTDMASAMQSQSFGKKTEEDFNIPFLSQFQKTTVADEIMVKINNLIALPEVKRIEETDEINKLLLKCSDFGKKIDDYTARNSVSAKVAELVLRVSLRMGYSQDDSILFYCAALVYDIGFLKIDKEIFQAERLTDEMFEKIKTHTELGQKMLYFVNKKYKPIFLDAISKHHENLDGTGYPNRLINYEIPFIARVIRVCESYVAVISKRAYKDSMNKNSAITELRNSTGRYDKKITDALEAII